MRNTDENQLEEMVTRVSVLTGLFALLEDNQVTVEIDEYS